MRLPRLYQIIWWVSFHSGAIGMVYLVVENFWRYVDRPGKLWRTLSHNSYGVYITHVILIGIFGTVLLNTSLLPALVKYPLLMISTYVGSNLLVSAYYAVKQMIAPKRKSTTSPLDSTLSG